MSLPEGSTPEQIARGHVLPLAKQGVILVVMKQPIRPEHAKVIARHVHEMVGYLHRLTGRLEMNGFVPQDRLMKVAAEARDRVQELWVLLHYMGCDAGVG